MSSPPQPEDAATSPPSQPGDVQVPSPPPQQGRSTVWSGVKLGLGACVVLPVLVILGLVFLVALFGGGDDTTTSSPPENQKKAESKKQDKQKAEPVEEPDPINLSGPGQMATSPFQLESGLAVFSMSYQGDRNFIANLLNQNGADAGRGALVNTIGSFQGSQAIQTRAGEHVLDVQASGPWTITIEQPRPSSAPQTTSFSGNSQAATDLFELSKGRKTFNMTHQGDRNFIVNLLDKNGADAGRGALVNDIGPFNGSKAIQVPQDDIYLLQVQASGPWTITVE